MPDIDGWAVDNMADNIINVLEDEFEFEKLVAESWTKAGEMKKFINERYDDYDLIYMMLPSYIEDLNTDKIITTFHGGPGIEGQADVIDRKKQNDLRISYVSHQVRDRVTTFENKTNRNIIVPLSGGQIDDIDMKLLIEQQRLDGVTKVKPDAGGNPTHGKARVNLHIWRKGFGLTNTDFFTPHGINPNEYKRTEEHKDGFTCGYAGWAKYILGGQPHHRRTLWIINAQRELNFHIKFAAGLSKHAVYDTHICKLRYNQTRQKAEFFNFEKYQMGSFYSKLDCYLVPDRLAGGPMPVLEAGLLGVPPVCTRAGVCGDIIEHMKTGYLCETYEEFVEGIKFMRENPDKRIEMGLNLKKYILENRTWEAVKHYWRDFFNNKGGTI